MVLATGLVDELPDVPGVRQQWGRGVLHCPYCHGWEVRDQRVGVLGTSVNAVHQALLLRGLTDDVTLFAHTMPEPDDDAWEQLAALGIRVVVGRVARLEVQDDVLRAVVLDDGHAFAVDAVAVQPRFVARGGLYEQLGGVLVDHPHGSVVPADPTGRTDVPGVWAAGNTRDLAAMVATAAGSGVLAGAAVHADLVGEDARAAVRARALRATATGPAAGPDRLPARTGNPWLDVFSPASEALVSRRVVGDRAHGLTAS